MNKSVEVELSKNNKNLTGNDIYDDMDNSNVKMALIDTDTSEVLGVYSAKDAKKAIVSGDKKHLREFLNSSKKSSGEFTEMFGNWYKFTYEEVLKNAKPQDAFRLLYLATFVNYNNGEIFLSDNTKSTVKNKVDIVDMLGISKKPAYETIANLQKLGYLIIKSDTVYLNTKVIAKGKGKSKKPYTRIFNDVIRELYVFTDAKAHSTMGQYLKLIPLINVYNNVLCKKKFADPLEQDINPLSIREISDATGVSLAVLSELTKKVIPTCNEHLFISVRINNYVCQWILNPRFTWGIKVNEHTAGCMSSYYTPHLFTNRRPVVQRKPIIKES